MDIQSAISRVQSATNIDELTDVLLSLRFKKSELSESVKFGVTGGKPARRDANKEAKSILKRVGTDHTLLTNDEREKLRQYSGLGGIGGSVHEYYTPDYIAGGIWDAMKINGFESGNIGEPSAGAGVFNGTKPKGVIITGSEMDGTSSQINQLLHPEDKIFHKTFEQLTKIIEDDHFDGFVGNVPFSKSRSTSHDDPEYQNIKQAERYFITRMLDKLKPEKLLCCVVPTQIISRKSWSNWREDISRKAEFLGAHRLPAGVFKDNGTDVVTDVIIMRKHPTETTEKIADLTDKTLESANLLWSPFINGKYFETSEGKKFVHGTAEKVQGQFGLVDSVKMDATFTQESMKAKLSRKFDSRIDWDSLELAEPVIKNYAEGDRRKINGRWYELIAGDWEIVKQSTSDGKLDKTRYGIESTVELKSLINSEPANILKLDFDQLESVIDDFEYLFEEQPKVVALYNFAKTQPPAYQERVFRGSIIGESIIELQNIATQTRRVPTAIAAQLRDQVALEIEKHGISANDRKIALLTGKNSNPWNAFSNATDKDGDYSDLLKGTLDVGETVSFDTNDASQVITKLHTQFDLNPVPFEEFEKLYTGSDAPKSLAEFAKLDGIAITPDGSLMPFDRATAGDIAKKTIQLRKALGQESNPHIQGNIQRQLDEIERKRKRNTDKEIEFTLNAKWISRKYINEFMQDAGYSDMAYIKAIEDDDGETLIDTDYSGEDGAFVGYTQTTEGKKRGSTSKISFERQLENHLNGLPVRSKDKSAAARYKDRIKVIEQQFADWIRQHDDVDLLTDKYNDTFNGYIPFEHSDSDLNLVDVSEDVKLLDYQNSGIRRLSEDGRGILAYGTGLGKTYTACGLLAHNKQLGRSKRAAVVVPKAVLENWYHEIKSFYGKGNVGSILFPAIDVQTDEDGNIEQELVLDENGEPKLNSHTGKQQYRDKIKLISNAKTIKERLAKIPQSNYDVVVLTKEQYSKLPVRPESVAEHIAERVAVGALKGKYVTNAKKYREAQKNESFKAKYADVGTKKYDDVPYFEDMGFDTVIVDEGHNYRNSYAVGYNASRLAYLTTAPSSDVAVDMALKSEYLRKKNGGRGTVLLTATPTVNSPTDIYNMLSLILSPEEWSLMGITDVDDFIELYGETAMESITKLSGEVEEQEALVGFKNLSGLRNLFHRWVNLKNAKDVSATVKIPSLIESKVNVTLTKEQKDIYEELRQRADDINEETKTTEVELPDGTKAQMEVPNGDTVFGIIRDMDRVTTDLDLYHRTMTFLLPEQDYSKVESVLENLPDELVLNTKQADKEDDDAETEKHSVSHNGKLELSGNSTKLVVHEAYEQLVIDALVKAGIQESDISHPVMPKYAKLVELVKNGLKDGKQIIFTEEKSQHNKLKRILAHQLGLSASKIGIINADTVAGKKKKASADEQEAGLEAIANAYNTGKHTILIANKKAEVGVNLHHGTTDTYHLTLPWTPSAIDQRNGRGARVGSKNDSMRVHYMLGDGSFDDYRLKVLMRKKQWMTELFKSTDEKMSNADAVASSEEMSMLLASNPEERAARDAKARKEKEAKIKLEKTRIAQVDLANFIKASHDVKWSVEGIKSEIESLQGTRLSLKEQVDELENKIRGYRYYQESERNTAERDLREINKQVRTNSKELISLQRQAKRIETSQKKYKQLKPQIAAALKSGLIDIDESILEQGDKSLLIDGKLITLGKIYNNNEYVGSGRSISAYKRIVEVTSVNFDLKEVAVKIRFTERGWSDKVGDTLTLEASNLGKESSYSNSELEIKNKLKSNLTLTEAVNLLDRDKFAKYLKSKELNIGNAYLLAYKDASNSDFETVSSSFLGMKADSIIYPDSSDKNLKAKIAKWLLLPDNRNNLSSYSVLSELLEHLYGKAYSSTVEDYGNTASNEQIQEWIQSQFSEFMTDEFRVKLKEIYEAKGYDFYLVNEMKNSFGDLPSEFDNKTQFKKSIDSAAQTNANAVIKEFKIELERVNEIRKALVAKYDANSIDDVKGRIDWLLESTMWSQTSSSLIVDFIKNENIGGDSDYHSMSLNERLAAVYSDLKRIDTTTHLSDDIAKSIKSSLGSSYTYDSAVSSWAQVQQDNKPVEPVVIERAEKAEKLIEADNNTPDKVNGVIVRLNAKAITVESKKVQQRGRWRTMRAVNYNEGEVYCLHDPRGKDGALFKVKNELKDMAGKGNYQYSADLNDDYPDSWWFIKSDAVTLDALAALLEV